MQWRDPSRNHNPLQSTTDKTSDVDLLGTDHTATKADGDPMIPIIDDGGQSSNVALSGMGNHIPLNDFSLPGNQNLDLDSGPHGLSGQAGPHDMDLSEYVSYEQYAQTEEHAGAAVSTRTRALIGLPPREKGPEIVEDQMFRDCINYIYNQHENILDNLGNPQQIAGTFIQFEQALKNCSEFVDKQFRAMNIYPQSDDSRSLVSLQPEDSKVNMHWECQLRSCPHRLFEKRGSFERHVKTQHFPSIIYCCSYRSPQGEKCNRQFRRKYNYQTHFTQSHKRKLVECVTTEEHHIQLECPGACSICFRQVLDWDEFYKCFFGHCKIPEH